MRVYLDDGGVTKVFDSKDCQLLVAFSETETANFRHHLGDGFPKFIIAGEYVTQEDKRKFFAACKVLEGLKR